MSVHRPVYNAEVQESLDFISQFCRSGTTPSGPTQRPPLQPTSFADHQPAYQSQLLPTNDSRKLALAAEINNQIVPNTRAHLQMFSAQPTMMQPSPARQQAGGDFYDTPGAPPASAVHNSTPSGRVTDALRYRNTPAPSVNQVPQSSMFSSAAAEPLHEPGSRGPGGPGRAGSVPSAAPTSAGHIHATPRRLEDMRDHSQRRESSQPSHSVVAPPQPPVVAPPQKESSPRVVAVEQATPAESHSATLEKFVMYLKGQYAKQDGEDDLGIDSLSDDDVFGLAQCFYEEIHNLVRAHRMQEQSEPPYQLQPLPTEKLPAEKPPIAVRPPSPQPASQQRSVSPQKVPVPVLPRHEPAVEAPPETHQNESVNQSVVAPASRSVSPAAQRGNQHAPTNRSVVEEGAAGMAPTQRVAKQQTSAPPSQVSVQRGHQQRQPMFRHTLPQCMKMMRQGTFLVKYARNGRPQLRYMCIKDKETVLDGHQQVVAPHLVWSEDVNSSKEGGVLCLTRLMGVGLGADAGSFKRNSTGSVVGIQRELVNPNWCFVLSFSSRNVEVCAQSQEDFEVWAGGMTLVLERNRGTN